MYRRPCASTASCDLHILVRRRWNWCGIAFRRRILLSQLAAAAPAATGSAALELHGCSRYVAPAVNDSVPRRCRQPAGPAGPGFLELIRTQLETVCGGFRNCGGLFNMRTSPPSPHAADSTSGWSDFWDRTVGQTVAGRWGGETADGVEGVDGRNQGTTPRHTLCVECTYWGVTCRGAPCRPFTRSACASTRMRRSM